MIYLRSQILRTVVHKDTLTGTFYRPATEVCGIEFPDMDDIQDDPSINRGGVVLITSLSELRTFALTFFYLLCAARVFCMSIITGLTMYQLRHGLNLFALGASVCGLVFLIAFNVISSPFMYPSGRLVDRLGRYVDLDTGESNLHGGCWIR